jgi:putative intracellular protease/amidase
MEFIMFLLRAMVSAALIAVTIDSPAIAGDKKVLMMVPDDFMWPEYEVPRTAYEKAGYQVVTAGKVKEELRHDRRNKTDFPNSKPITPDLRFEDVKVEDYAAVADGNIVTGRNPESSALFADKVLEVLKTTTKSH